MNSPPARASGAILIEKSTKTMSPTTFVTLYTTCLSRTHPSLHLSLPPPCLRPLLHHDHLPLGQRQLLLARRLVRRDHLRQLHLLPGPSPLTLRRLLLFLLLQRVRTAACAKTESDITQPSLQNLTTSAETIPITEES